MSINVTKNDFLKFLETFETSKIPETLKPLKLLKPPNAPDLRSAAESMLSRKLFIGKELHGGGIYNKPLRHN